MLDVGQDLLHALETRELGQPSALGTVVVGGPLRADCLPKRDGN